MPKIGALAVLISCLNSAAIDSANASRLSISCNCCAELDSSKFFSAVLRSASFFAFFCFFKASLSGSIFKTLLNFTNSYYDFFTHQF